MFSRHELIWLTGRGWDAALKRALPGQLAAIEQWQHEDWPAIVRRADAGLGPGQVSLGIALAPAPDGAKRRIALNSSGLDVARSSAALALDVAAKAAPEQWSAALDALVLQSNGLVLRTYGSLAMQAITGQSYLRPSSDIDLLFFPADVTALRAGLALLEQYAAMIPLDGEIVFPSGEAVAWKEWMNAEQTAARVLVKDASAVRLVPTAALLATLKAPC
jgi:phosphoribosyl-dephospho-CoA transferase